ncbi:hypothetical protein VTK56DRAFT_1555 [Thermocarpiscus australiensis]
MNHELYQHHTSLYCTRNSENVVRVIYPISCLLLKWGGVLLLLAVKLVLDPCTALNRLEIVHSGFYLPGQFSLIQVEWSFSRAGGQPLVGPLAVPSTPGFKFLPGLSSRIVTCHEYPEFSFVLVSILVWWPATVHGEVYCTLAGDKAEVLNAQSADLVCTVQAMYGLRVSPSHYSNDLSFPLVPRSPFLVLCPLSP